jgi:hypothetical protein
MPNGARGTVKDYIKYILYQEAQQKLLMQATQEIVDELRANKSLNYPEKNCEKYLEY